VLDGETSVPDQGDVGAGPAGRIGTVPPSSSAAPQTVDPAGVPGSQPDARQDAAVGAAAIGGGGEPAVEQESVINSGAADVVPEPGKDTRAREAADAAPGWRSTSPTSEVVADPAPATGTLPVAAPPAGFETTHDGPPAETPHEPDSDDDAGATPAPWAELVANPGRAPELLAVAAVRAIGPRARDWATRTRAAYPTAPEDALARLAAQQFGRPARLGPLLGTVAGSYAPAFLLATTAIVRAELVLHIAAAYGEDPTDPGRAADLLAITEIPGKSEKLRKVAARSATWAALRLANRHFPGTTLLAALLAASADTQATASRAIAHYRRRKPPATAS
jgi:hypothetical protein